MSSQENLNIQDDDPNRLNIFNGESTENTYYSWKKRHEANLITSSRKNSKRKLYSTNPNKRDNIDRNNSNPKNKMGMSLK